jgi:hypothetical protein
MSLERQPQSRTRFGVEHQVNGDLVKTRTESPDAPHTVQEFVDRASMLFPRLLGLLHSRALGQLL